MKHLVLSAIALCLAVGVAGADTFDLPLVPVADESGFGSLHASLVSPFTAIGYAGTLTTRVYTDTAAAPANVATFVWELQVDAGSLTAVEDMTLAATGLQNDLRILQIIGGVNGYVTGTDVPDVAQATNNVFPTVDSLFYEWGAADRLAAGEVATLYCQVTGVTQMGEVNAGIQNLGGANATALAPVDDPNSPDLTVPEPATMTLLGLGAVGLLRRRR